MGVGNFFGCLPESMQTAAYTAWSWTASLGVLRKNCTRRLTLPWLALNRGEKEKILSVKIEAPVEDILRFLSAMQVCVNVPVI